MKRKILVIGLDGATLDVLSPLMAQGALPNLEKIVRRGASGPLYSTIPPATGPAWLSLATGLKPESTGVFDFWVRRGDSYRLHSLNSDVFQGRSIWDLLSRAGKNTGVFCYPMLRPPYEIRGFMTTGLGAWPVEEFTFPVELKQEIFSAAGGPFELLLPYHEDRYDDLDLFLSHLEEMLEKQARAAEYLLLNKPWDLFWVVFSQTDWLQHLFWRHLDPGHSLHEGSRSEEPRRKFQAFWSKIDSVLGRLIDQAGPETNICILSDHGFGTNDKVFKLNAWLERKGYLVRKEIPRSPRLKIRQGAMSAARQTARRLRIGRLFPGIHQKGRQWMDNIRPSVLDQIDLEKSTAFDPGHTIPFGGIYIHDRAASTRESRLKITTRIAQELKQWGDENHIKIKTWHPYGSGNPGSTAGPDLLVAVDDWSCVLLKDRFDGELLEARPHSPRHTGSHRMNGILLACGPDIKNTTMESARIIDITPTLLYLFDLPLPSNLDGKVIDDLITAEYLDRHPVMKSAPTSKSAPPPLGPKAPDSDDEAIRKMLKDLGYM